MTVLAYAGTYVLAWTASLVTNLLACVRGVLALVAPASVAEFFTRPYVFSGLCMVLVAVIANGAKLLMWWKDNALRRERDTLRQAQKQELA